MQQIPEIGRWRLSVGYRQKHISSRVAFTRCGSRPGDLSKDSRRRGLIGRLLSLLLSGPFLSLAAARKFALTEGKIALHPRRERAFYFRLGLIQSRFGALRLRSQLQCPPIMLSRQRIHSSVHRRFGGGQRILYAPQPVPV